MSDDDVTGEQLIERGWILEETTSPSSPAMTCLKLSCRRCGGTVISVQRCRSTRSAALDAVRSAANQRLVELRIERERGANMGLPSWRRWP